MNVCIFCSSGSGVDTTFAAAAFTAGKSLAENGCTLIHGGSTAGLMGALVDGVETANGKIIGITCREVRNGDLEIDSRQQTIITCDLPSRKRLMLSLADRFLILPGGFGTLDEATEILTRKQLGLLTHPIAFINTDNYWDHFFTFLSTAQAQAMVTSETATLFQIYPNIEEYLQHENLRDI